LDTSGGYVILNSENISPAIEALCYTPDTNCNLSFVVVVVVVVVVFV